MEADHVKNLHYVQKVDMELLAKQCRIGVADLLREGSDSYRFHDELRLSDTAYSHILLLAKLAVWC